MTRPYRRLKLSAFLAFLAFYLFPLATYVRGEDAIFMWLLFSVPGLVLLLLPERASSIARGLAIGQSMVFGAITGLAVCTGVPTWLVSRGNGLEIAEFTVVLIGQAALFFAAIRLPPAGMDGNSSTVTWLTVPPTIAVLVLAMMRLGEVSRHNMTPNAAYRVVACAESYASNHHGEYPDSLKTMSQIPNCLYPFDERGHSNQGQVRYEPLRSTDGRVKGYSLLFGPETFFGNLRSAEYTDQSGIVHEPKSHPIASGNDPVRDNTSTSLAQWSQCLVKYRQSHPEVAFPRELREMLNPTWPCRPYRDVEGNHLLPDNSYTVYYQARAEAGSKDLSTFSLQARPNRYGETGIRSYYVDESGIIRVTVKNRSANENDAPIPSCEWNVGMLCQAE